jgi:outer membrane protein assembly factor BamB
MWRLETEAWVASSPTIVDGAVYFGSDDGHLYAVR